MQYKISKSRGDFGLLFLYCLGLRYPFGREDDLSARRGCGLVKPHPRRMLIFPAASKNRELKHNENCVVALTLGPKPALGHPKRYHSTI